MNIVDIINKKRVKEELTREELEMAFNGYLKGFVKDYQMSSLLMAICINGMTERETFDLVDIFIKSGDVLDLSSIPGIKVDKHSTGGIGDKITLIIGPIVASCGVIVPKMMYEYRKKHQDGKNDFHVKTEYEKELAKKYG